MSAFLGFHHRFVAGDGTASPLVLLLLHGTGGNESDLLPIGRALLPGAPLLSPRGPVLESGLPRFFRRFADGRFDEDDLRRRAADLSRFVADAATSYEFDPDGVVAVGYSNGADIATATLFLYPDLFAGAVLFRPMVPLPPETPVELGGLPVLLAAGHEDAITPEADTDRLQLLLETSGACVDRIRLGIGHRLSPSEITAAHGWILRNFNRICSSRGDHGLSL